MSNVAFCISKKLAPNCSFQASKTDPPPQRNSVLLKDGMCPRPAAAVVERRFLHRQETSSKLQLSGLQNGPRSGSLGLADIIDVHPLLSCLTRTSRCCRCSRMPPPQAPPALAPPPREFDVLLASVAFWKRCCRRRQRVCCACFIPILFLAK